jgi:class 3 adenylate cyclase
MAALPSGTVTFLFTDLEGSTGKWERHPDEMRGASARHDALLRAAVEAQGGHVVKSTGDGIHAVFSAAPAAALAAMDAVGALSAETWEATGPLRIRVGIHTGEADERDGDYFGLALNRASRLMAAAHGGQVVLSQVTAELVRDALPEGLRLLDLGEHRLRSLERPEHIYELTVAGLDSQFPPLQSLHAFPGDVPLPAPSFARGDDGLAGRHDELERLGIAWRRARDGVRQLVFIDGEPGIGKTRLAGALARRAHDEGGVVLYGRCDEEAIVPYQPFVEALRPCVGAYAPSALRETLRGLEHDLVRVFPELSGRFPAAPAPTSGDPVAERYRLFEAITTLLTGIAATRCTALVLDDLHWADKPTLLLLRHLVRSEPRVALLVVLCYRNVELHHDEQLANLLADLRKEPSVTRLRLGGLAADDSAELVRTLADRELGAPVLAALHHETDGNPFFVEELVRHLVETDALPRERERSWAGLGTVVLPESVREVIAQRLRRLPTSVYDLLTRAAVVGREFDTALLARASGEPTESVLEALDRAADAGLVREDPAHFGRYSFSHALVRQTLTAALGSSARARLHARVGEVLETAGGPGRMAAELALHFTRAVPLVGADKAIAYTTQAGRDAIADLAFEDAAGHFESALQLLGQYEPDETGPRIDVLTDLASALVYVDERIGVRTAMRAVDAARTDGTPTQFGRAVAVAVEPVYGVLAFPADVTRLFDEARAVLGGGDVALRARLLAFESFKYACHVLHGRPAQPLAEEAVALARLSDDPVTLADALYALAVSLEGAADLAERQALGEELVALGPSAGARASAFGFRVIAGVHLEGADAGALASAIAELGRVGVEMRWLPAQVYAAQFRAAQALLEGRFQDVERHGEELHRFARAYHGAGGMRYMQATFLAREQGRLEGRALAAQMSDEPDDDLYTRATLALAQLDAGDEIAARLVVDRLVAEDIGHRAKETGFGSALGMLAEVAASVGTRAQAARIHDQMTPFAGRLLTTMLGVACLGAADRYLGMLSTAIGHWDEAEAHFDRALAIEEGARGHALMARTRYWQARLFRQRGRPGDARMADAILAAVIDDSSRLGMQGLRARAEDLRAG